MPKDVPLPSSGGKLGFSAAKILGNRNAISLADLTARVRMAYPHQCFGLLSDRSWMGLACSIGRYGDERRLRGTALFHGFKQQVKVIILVKDAGSAVHPDWRNKESA